MGACGSKDIPRQAGDEPPRNLSRWQADAGESTGPLVAAHSDEAQTHLPDSTRCDLTLNSVVAYATPSPENATAELCATGWEDGSIQIQSWRTHAVATTFKPHARAVNRILIGPRTGAIYSCSRDTTVAVLPSLPANGVAVDTSAMPVVLAGHTLNVSTITVDSDESSLCSGGRDTQTILWDLSTATIKAKNTTAQNVITCSKWLPGERVIAQGSEDLSVKLWDERNALRTPAQTLRGYIYFPLCLDVSSDGLYLLTSSKGFNGVGCEVRVWDRRMGRQLHQLDGHQQDATACCFLPPSLSPRGENAEATTDVQISMDIPPLATGSKDGTVKVWDVTTSQPVCEAHEPSTRMFTSISHAGDGVILASTLHGSVHAFKFDPHTKSLAIVN